MRNLVAKNISAAALATALLASGVAHAVTLPASAVAPVGVGAQRAAGVVNTGSAIHHSTAEPIVTSAVPTTAPVAAGVTRGTANIGTGISGTGKSIASNGVTVSPSGARGSIVNTVKGNGVASARVGNTQIGGGNRPVVAVNVASSSPRAGTLAAVGAADSNALLSATVAPQ